MGFFFNENAMIRDTLKWESFSDWLVIGLSIVIGRKNWSLCNSLLHHYTFNILIEAFNEWIVIYNNTTRKKGIRLHNINLPFRTSFFPACATVKNVAVLSNMIMKIFSIISTYFISRRETKTGTRFEWFIKINFRVLWWEWNRWCFVLPTSTYSSRRSPSFSSP